jgi:beta-glucanase (GH16 family)
MNTRILVFLLFPFLFFSCKQNTPSGSEELAGLIWSDEFDGNRIDFNKWTPETGAHGWGNNELQNYTAIDNIEVSNGTLKIIAKKVGNGQEPGDYTSARLNSNESFLYGRMEIRAKIPDLKGNGLWPAIWMLGENISEVGWPASGEIDIMEYVSYAPNQFYSTIHSAANNWVDGTAVGSGSVSLNNIEEEFNVFGLTWTENDLRFYVNDPDNIIFYFRKPANPTSENWPFDKPFYFLLNMAVGGNWGGAQGVNDANFPAVFEIDYVRVFELE